MKRKIKFRAWNGTELQYSHEFNSLEAFWGITDDAGYGDFRTVYQQFTGLLDKNGKEIYEGDIVEFYLNGKVYQDMVVFENFGWYLVNDNGAFPLTNGLEYLVIGNTFEQVKL